MSSNIFTDYSNSLSGNLYYYLMVANNFYRFSDEEIYDVMIDLIDRYKKNEDKEFCFVMLMYMTKMKEQKTRIEKYLIFKK